MENMRLTSLQDHSDYLETLEIPDAEKWRLHCQRKNFGKQPLSLSMFVPTSETGEVLEEPKHYNEWIKGLADGNGFGNKEMKAYVLAKSNCLFYGFTYKYEFLYFNGKRAWITPLKGTVEEIVQLGLPLTKQAINQIFK